jgi:uncharacterized NAD(P)/FAD-binding protein YdhS
VARHGRLSARTSDRYVARSAYGAWLRHELDRAVASGLVDLRAEEIIGVVETGKTVHLSLTGGGTWTAALAVLCPGNPKPRPLAIAPPGRTIADMWAPGVMDGIAAEEPVLIVGTGATGIDAMLELHHRGHRGPIHLLSRRGLLPLIDAPPKAYTLKRTIVDEAPRLATVVALLRQEAEEAGADGHAWQSVVDAFRAHLPRLWSGLSQRERGRFLRHLRPYWLIHRHRLAPDIAELIDRLRAEGRLMIVRGRLRAAREDGNRVVVDIVRHGGGPVSLTVGHLINCTGPEEDVRRLDDPLASHLLRSGMARPGAFGVGLDVDGEARLLRADGTPQARLFVLGGATRTRFGEVTSAPQIRRRASILVGSIASTLEGTGHSR